MTAPTDEEAIARFIKMLCKQRLSTERDDDAEGGDYEGAYDAFINEARALLPRLSAGSGWRQISEAPRDGTPVLAAIANGVSYVAWHRKGQWCFFDDGKSLRMYFDPTHFRLLPSPPGEG